MVGKRVAAADRLRIDTGLPYSFNLGNGKIELPADVQAADSRRPLKRKRDLISSPAAPAKWQQLTPWPWGSGRYDLHVPIEGEHGVHGVYEPTKRRLFDVDAEFWCATAVFLQRSTRNTDRETFACSLLAAGTWIFAAEDAACE
jgi:hypothetical protein